MTTSDIDRIRGRIKNPDTSEVDPEEVADDRERLLEASRIMRRHRDTWQSERHVSVLQRLIMLSWGGKKYSRDEMHDASLTETLTDKETAEEIVDWIHDRYTNEETNRDMRNALRLFGKLLTNDDPTDSDASPPPSIDWISATTPSNYKPRPNPADMISWDEVVEMCEHPGTNARDAALLAVAWDAHPRSGELQDLKVGDVSDHDFGKTLRLDGKTGPRDVTITNAVPYLRQWLNQHPRPDDTAPLWSKLRAPAGISYRMFRNIFSGAAGRVNLNKPDNPTNFRKSGISALASKGMSQSHLEKRAGWERGSDVAARYISIFGDESDHELAEVRGMDVNIEEPEPTGPTDCIRCGELIQRDAETCGNCGAVQDPVKAQETAEVMSGDLTSLMRGAAREELEDLLRDPSTDDLQTLLDEFGLEQLVRSSIEEEIERAIEERLEDSTRAGG